MTTWAEDISISELNRKIVRIEEKVDALVEAMASQKIATAGQLGRLQGGIGVLVFLGSILGVVVGWFSKTHT